MIEAIEVWRSDNGTPMAAIHGPDRAIGSWFVLTWDELERVCLKGGIVSDIAHRLESGWDRWLFYDINPPRDPEGVMAVKYRSIEMPSHACRALLQIACDALDAYYISERDQWGHRPRLRIDVSEDYTYWTQHFGQGKGQVNVRWQDDATRARIAIDMWRDQTGTCEDMYERILTIARNTTQSRDETAEAYVAMDWDGYFWRAGCLVGGLINHGSQTQPNWSLHT